VSDDVTLSLAPTKWRAWGSDDDSQERWFLAVDV
jgi:hypothetical protein